MVCVEDGPDVCITDRFGGGGEEEVEQVEDGRSKAGDLKVDKAYALGRL